MLGELEQAHADAITVLVLYCKCNNRQWVKQAVYPIRTSIAFGGSLFTRTVTVHSR